MKHVSPTRVAFCLTLALTGCASPPEPVAVQWENTHRTVNSAIPRWQENNRVVPSPRVAGEWTLKAVDFKGDDGQYDADFYYAVAHANRIVVASHQGEAWFSARDWLQAHGATPVIEYRDKTDCLRCDTVDVTLSRINKAAEPVALLKNNHTDNKTRATGEGLPEKTQALPTSAPLMKPLLRQWHARAGLTLQGALKQWSSDVPCGTNGKWHINWHSQKDYSIDSDLLFSGDYFDAVTQLFNLYQTAESPLYADIYKSQCLIIISDNKEGVWK